ncbi:oxygen-independent coproporphyrinogen III oxidase [Haliscomenobacter hydrossis DSM 1100]|uniref:Heme chaperone HemW n=2 Tax=Haliscomenobacter TaxID=2349 RepID=F4KZN7_HALH1|nr:oxygen-independent coproporphyrinogen III oxidase [Haliscomenobacter hydrossis DSM 1100]
MVDAIVRELELQKDYLQGAPLSSIYFGGGTPSLLDAGELERIFAKIYQLHAVEVDAEITLEANPDDLDLLKLQALRNTPVNRLSIGIQSFAEEDLRFMNRAHNAQEARACIENALSQGFKNLTLDLIYGAPTTSHAQWAKNLETIFQYPIPHLSAYCLTVEPKTALDHFVKKGLAAPVDEEHANAQFQHLMEATKARGFEHYEISNFAQPGWYARHNSSYWQGEPYLGIGPSAHSFNGSSRQWNVANNAKYLKILNDDTPPTLENSGLFERETLSPATRYNEYVMTGLRTIWGCSLDKIDPAFRTFFLENIQPFITKELVLVQEQRYRLSDTGKFMADHIASELFFIENN